MNPTAGAQRARMPRQVPYIIGNEACERFSFYGMRNILVGFLASSVILAYLPEGARDGAAKDVFHSFVFYKRLLIEECYL
jgi:POT family proton-dependent oligopeptide transporter